jgi:hypothetical protein
MFLLRLSTLLSLYIPQFPARCREYVGEIYELEYYYHPPILFLSSFSFSISFFIIFFTFQFTIPTTIDGPYLSFYQNIPIGDLVLKDLLEEIQ